MMCGIVAMNVIFGYGAMFPLSSTGVLQNIVSLFDLLIFFFFVGNSTTNLFIKPSPVLSDPNVAAGAVGIEVPPKSAEPYFIVPPGFRANTFFVGMEKELQELDRRLFDRRRRDGTACVLIHGQPGGGKSHLARQYVNKNRKKFQGGIFWIIAKFREERLQAYWNIHQKVVARESPELCASVNGNENTFVESVKTWFESRQEWLIVFDGVVVDKDADATELQSFVPDSRNSSIIYISRAKNLESKQRLLRPFPIKVSPLKEEDARKLLFKELHIRKPTEAETKNATELVRKIGGLPLAIDAISHRLADTHEPLAKYNMKSYSADPKMGGTYNKILDDLQRLGHIEAWNLIHILCFYGQHIPFEMVHLGLKSLRSYPVEVKSCEDGGKADIDTTFGILMRYALIERNEPDDKASMSSSRDSLVDPEPIDMLKMHSVVQKFCCDSLNAQRLLPTWLGYAARLFSYSFKQADIKIKQRPEPGRISDYRYYLVHGQRLWDHSQAYESRNQRLASVREVLSPVLAEINDEIQFREPSSSQESVNRGIFQISIFDRTSSSSESGPSLHEARTPDHRPTPLPMPNQNLYGMDLDKPSIDSPGSFRTLSPIEPRIVANSPSVKMPPYYQDPGYESDREGLYQSQMMQKNPSDLTARPPSSKENHGAGWQVVPPTKKPRKGRDLGSFRPTPAKAQVNRMPAIGSVARPAQERGERLRPSVDAFASLREVNYRSPPRSSQGGVSFWQRGPSPKQQPLKPTYAGIAARKPLQPGPRPGASEPLTSSNVMERATSEESLRGRQGNADQSPLATEFFPHRGSAGSIPQQSSNFTTRPLGESHIDDSSHSSRDQQYILPPAGSFLSDPSRPRYMTENLNPSHSSSHTRGRNPAPLPLDRDIQVTPTARPFLFDFESPRHSPPYPSTRPPSRSPRSQPHVPYQSGITSSTSNSPFPTGYYSQPMSRHESHNSHNSVAETEPLHQHHPSASFSPPPPPVPPFASPRDRDGRPLPKSPKTTDYASATHEISGAGGWAYPSSVSPPVMARPMYSDAVAGGGMSRSSSGPGIAVEGGLGIVQVDGVVQFGEHDPVRVEDARRRAWEWEEQLKRQRAERDWRAERADGIDRDGGERDGERGRRGEWESEGGRGRTRLREQERKGQGEGSGSGSRSLRPYPNVNLIPTFTDPVKMSDLL